MRSRKCLSAGFGSCVFSFQTLPASGAVTAPSSPHGSLPWIPSSSPPHPHRAGAARLLTDRSLFTAPLSKRGSGSLPSTLPFPSFPCFSQFFPFFFFFLRSDAEVLDEATRGGVGAQLNKNPSLRAALVSRTTWELSEY